MRSVRLESTSGPEAFTLCGPKAFSGGPRSFRFGPSPRSINTAAKTRISALRPSVGGGASTRSTEARH
jgi:hypothetical protein